MNLGMWLALAVMFLAGTGVILVIGLGRLDSRRHTPTHLKEDDDR